MTGLLVTGLAKAGLGVSMLGVTELIINASAAFPQLMVLAHAPGQHVSQPSL